MVVKDKKKNIEGAIASWFHLSHIPPNKQIAYITYLPSAPFRGPIRVWILLVCRIYIVNY